MLLLLLLPLLCFLGWGPRDWLFSLIRIFWHNTQKLNSNKNNFCSKFYFILFYFSPPFFLHTFFAPLLFLFLFYGFLFAAKFFYIICTEIRCTNSGDIHKTKKIVHNHMQKQYFFFVNGFLSAQHLELHNRWMDWLDLIIIIIVGAVAVFAAAASALVMAFS